MLGIVPFFHSLGFTVTLWGPLLLDIRAAYHFSPLDARIVAKLARAAAGDDPARHADVPAQLPAALRAGGAEVARSRRRRRREAADPAVRRVRAEVRRPARRRLRHDRALAAGVGQRAAEPLARASNVDCKEGSVGRPVPGVSVKVVDPETFEDLAARHARHAAGERPERDEGLPRPARGNGQGDARRLVRHRRHRHDRHRRLHPHHRPA